MFASKSLIHRLAPVLITLVLLGSTIPLAVSAAMPNTDQWSGEQESVLASSNAQANIYLPLVQRSMCGKITVDTTWTVTASPIRVACDVIVSSGVTLTIEAGVMVQFAHTDDDLIISGTLQAAGAEYAPIHFNPSSNTTPGSWGRVAFMAGSSGLLDHAVLEYGGSSGSMVSIASDAVQVVDSVVQHGAYTGISIQSASPLIDGSRILSNGGSGLSNDTGNPIIQNNTISNNSISSESTSNGGGLYNSSGNPTIQNNIISNNFIKGFPSNGGGLYNGSGNPLIQNNTITDNRADPVCFRQYCGGSFGGGLYTGNGNPIIRNNIIINNDSMGGSGIWSETTAPLNLDFNDVWNNNTYGVTSGAHDISVDPLLVDPANGDFHLAPDSPCIDSGDPDQHSVTDFEGQPRPMGLAPDIGADESRTLSVVKTREPGEALPGGTITYTVAIENPEPFTMTTVQLTDTLPGETTLTGFQAEGLTCTHDGSTWGGQLSCVLDSPSLAPGKSHELTVTVLLTNTFLTPRIVTNYVVATASSAGDSFTAGDRASTWIRWCWVQINDKPVGSDLQAAIDASSMPSDVLKVSGHCLVHDLNLSKTLTLQGGWSYDFSHRDPAVYRTTLDAQRRGRVVEVLGNVIPTFEGFLITNGLSHEGGGLYCDTGNPTIRNNIFRGNIGSGMYNKAGNPLIQNNLFTGNSIPDYNSGGGLHNVSGNPIIQSNTFAGNSAYSGGGLSNAYGNPIIQDNTFSGNIADGFGGGLINGSGHPSIQNNIFTHNRANALLYGGGGLANFDGSPAILNNIFNGNISQGSGGGLYNISGNPTIYNNIFSNNAAIYDRGVIYDDPEGESPTSDYNDLWNNTGFNYVNVTPGIHDISVDPLWVEPVLGNYHLAAGSPCIDAGDPDHHAETDIDGQPRPMGLAPDIGVDEILTLRVTKSAIPVETTPGNLITYTVTLVNMETFTLTNVLLTDTLPTKTAYLNHQASGLTCSHDGSAWGGPLCCTLDTIILAPGESRGLTLTVLLSDTYPSEQYVTNPVTLTASSAGDTFIARDQARTWVSWCKVQLNDQPVGSSLQNALDASTQPTDRIKVSGHCPVQNLGVNKTLSLQGGWNDDFSLWDPAVYTTTLDGLGLGRVITVGGYVTPTIEGFLITGGNSDQGGGLYIGSASPIIQNNTILHNTTTGKGGGLYIESGNPTIRDNTITGNSAFYGGGVYNDSGNPMIQNNTFYGNSVEYILDGGGIYNNTGNPTIQDNTFIENVAEGWAHDGCGGGVYNASGSPPIQRNTFIGNMAADGGGVYTENGNPIIQDNLFSNYETYASYTGGGMAIGGGNPIVQNNIFVNNSAIYGGGMYIQGGNPLIRSNTFYQNYADFGGGLYISSGNTGIVFISNVLVNNTAGSGGGIYKYYGGFTPDYNDVWNNTGGDYYTVTPGAHDISADPLLVDPANGDFHLAAGSPCIDAGDPLNYPAADFEGDPRPIGLAPDIGVDEFGSVLYLPLVRK